MRTRRDPGMFWALTAATILTLGIMSLPWAVDHLASIIDTARQVLIVVAGIVVCVFLAVGSPLADRFARSREVSSRHPVRRCDSLPRSDEPIHTRAQRTRTPRARTALPEAARSVRPFSKDIWR